MNFQELEAVEGLRMTWNAWPSTRQEALRCVLPFGVLFSPLRSFTDLPLVPHSPVECASCGAVINPYCTADFTSHTWTCALCCKVRNRVPILGVACSKSDFLVKRTADTKSCMHLSFVRFVRCPESAWILYCQPCALLHVCVARVVEH